MGQLVSCSAGYAEEKATTFEEPSFEDE